jgi:hypothetical protein
MILQPTILQLTNMMEFLNIWSFIIPSYNMPPPKETEGYLYRPVQIYRLTRSGSMAYWGSGDPKKPDVHIGGIVLIQTWIDRAYIHLTQQVRETMKAKTVASSFPHIEELLVRFHGLDFIVLDKSTTEICTDANQR